MDFPELLATHGVACKKHGEHEHTTEGWIQFDCPFCSPNSLYFRMGYNLASRSINCWVCGRQYLVDVIKEITGISASKAYEFIKGLPQKELVRTIRTGTLKLPNGLGPLLNPHKAYLRKRGFHPEEIEKLWKIQGIGQHGGLLRWSLFIPVFFHGEMVTWTTRSINPEASKRYRAATAADSLVAISDILYGADFVLNSVVIVEGPLDVWKIGPGAVALCGKGMSSGRMQTLSKIPNRAICLDTDSQNRAWHMTHDLAVFAGSTINIVLETGKDAAECSDEEVNQLRRFLK